MLTSQNFIMQKQEKKENQYMNRRICLMRKKWFLVYNPPRVNQD
jgi:hypothetical protein